MKEKMRNYSGDALKRFREVPYQLRCGREQEEEIFSLLARGFIPKEISMKICIPLRTVERRIFDIKQKVKRLEGDLNGKSF